MENKRVWRPRMEIKRVWRPTSGQGDSGDLPGRARVPCGDNGTPPDFELSRELWTWGRSATSRQWSGTQACHKHHGDLRDGGSGQNIGWKLCVRDKWVNQESRTLDPEWKDSADRAQDRRALAAGSVDHEESNHQDQLKYQSE